MRVISPFSFAMVGFGVFAGLPVRDFPCFSGAAGQKRRAEHPRADEQQRIGNAELGRCGEGIDGALHQSAVGAEGGHHAQSVARAVGGDADQIAIGEVAVQE